MMVRTGYAKAWKRERVIIWSGQRVPLVESMGCMAGCKIIRER